MGTEPATNLRRRFVNTVNFFHEFKGPKPEKKWGNFNSRGSKSNDQNLGTDGDSENNDETEYDLYGLSNNQLSNQPRRKSIKN